MVCGKMMKKRERECKGIEPALDSLDKSTNPAQGGAKSGALTPRDPDLAALVAAWPTLPPALKAGIVALIQAHGLHTGNAAGGE